MLVIFTFHGSQFVHAFNRMIRASALGLRQGEMVPPDLAPADPVQMETGWVWGRRRRGAE